MANGMGQPTRDQFATAAMQALMLARGSELLVLAAGAPETWAAACANVAAAAYVMADAMAAEAAAK